MESNHSIVCFPVSFVVTFGDVYFKHCEIVVNEKSKLLKYNFVTALICLIALILLIMINSLTH